MDCTAADHLALLFYLVGWRLIAFAALEVFEGLKMDKAITFSSASSHFPTLDIRLSVFRIFRLSVFSVFRTFSLSHSLLPQ